MRTTLLFSAISLALASCQGCPPPAPPPGPTPPDASASDSGGASGCQASCPTPPAGCERTTVDPGACTSESGCTAPLPVCHYRATQPNTDCPATLAGRCIPPN